MQLSRSTGALMNILLQKFAMSMGPGVRQAAGGRRERRSRENFSLAAHFIAFHFAAVTPRIAARIAQAEAVCPI